jgi:pSer/pThr/pTyr-binding forkhead associated (FHA) protein
VSRVHCQFLVLADGELEVRDLESTNGTYVNGERRRTGPARARRPRPVGRVELVALKDE